MSHCWMIAATSPSGLNVDARDALVDRLAHVATLRTAMPSAAIAALTSPTVSWPEWKTDAASTASAPAAIAGAKSLGSTGTARGDHRDAGDLAHEADELEVEALAGAVGIDGVDQQLSGAAFDRLARPQERVEGRLGASAVGGDDESRTRSRSRRLTSSESTSTWAPNRSAISSMSSGRAIAAEFTPILSAPTDSSRATSSGVRTPPPTVSGMNTSSAVRRTTS